MDAVTFQTEVRQIEKLLYRIAWSYLGNAQDVEDAVQDALLKAWEKRSAVREPAQFRPWLTQILSNRCRDLLRRRKRRSFYPLEEATVLVEGPAPQAPIMEAIERMKPQERMLIVLHYVDGCPLEELANALGLPVGTVKSRLHTARKHLSKTLLVDWEEEI